MLTAPSSSGRKVKWFPHSLEFFKRDGIWKLNATLRRERSEWRVGRLHNGYYDGKTYHAGRLGVRPDLHHRDRVYFALLYTFIEDACAGREGPFP